MPRATSTSATVTDIHAGPRRALINAAVWAAADEPGGLPHPDPTDDERLMALAERLGDVAAAHLRGHRDVSDELLKLLGTAAGWLDRVEAREDTARRNQ